MGRKKILLLGDINIDTVWPVPEFPIPGRDGLVDELAVEIGGAVLNSAIMLDHLGQQSRLLGCVGKDVWADKIARTVEGTSIDLTQLQIEADFATGLTFIIVTPDGERTMFSYRGANIQLRENKIREEAFRDTAILHISGYALMKAPQKNAVWRAVELAKKFSIPISLDTGLEPAIKNPEELQRLLGELAICISGPEEIEVLLGSTSEVEAADSLISTGVKLAAIKLGKKGSIVTDGNERFLCPAFKVDAVDTTGAGDSYSAGLLYGWTHGLSLGAKAVLASSLGAMAASVYGAGFSLPELAHVVNFLKLRGKELPAELKPDVEEVIGVLEKELSNKLVSKQ